MPLSATESTPMDYRYERGGVLFYAGFDGSRDASANGEGKTRLINGGGAITAAGFDSVRGSALQSGDGIGHLEFAAEGNVIPAEGTIEIWIKPADWSDDDNQNHVFIDIVGDGRIHYRKRADTVSALWVQAPRAKAPNHFDDRYAGMAVRGYSSEQREGKWQQFFLIWRQGEPLRYYQGFWHGSEWILVDAGDPQGAPAPSPGKLETIVIGDVGEPGRNAFSYIDEVYIYNRALTWEECVWAFENARGRQPGTDIPSNFAQPTIKVVPDPRNKTLVVEVDSGDRSGDFAGWARLEPAMGTERAPVIQTEGRFGRASVPYRTLPEGDYEIICDITTKAGSPRTTVKRPLAVPGPPVWLDEKVGVSDIPPPPWPAITAQGNRLGVWGREYALGAFGLPRQIVTQKRSILAAPVTLRFVQDGKDIAWDGPAGSVTKQTAAEWVFSGVSTSVVGEMRWSVKAEFDGFLTYDFELAPGSNATADVIELRVPIEQDCALLYTRSTRERGFLPKGTGAIYKAAYGRYWWIGTDEFGLCGATEHNGATLDVSDEAFTIVREANRISVVYRFLGHRRALGDPWKLRWVLQATPTRPLPKGWRNLRERKVTPGGKLAVSHPYPMPETFAHFSFPVLRQRHVDWYRDFIRSEHAQGIRVLPYSMFVTMPPEMPECVFYWREWFNPAGEPTQLSGREKYAAARLVPSYIDFLVWKHRELARSYGHDGLYVDYGGVYGRGVFAPEHGLGYERDGKRYPAQFPVVAVREIWKRVYTMFKELNPDSLMVAHVSNAVHAPVMTFADICLNGERNWYGALRDNYLDVLTLDQLRAEFRGQPYGSISWFLPQWHKALLDDKDVAERSDGTSGIPAGQPEWITVEKTHHLFGLGLLLDIGFWPIWCTSPGAIKEYYGILDAFGMDDAAFLGYWSNAALIGGQTETIKASAYRKRQGGALIVIYNTARETQSPTLEIDWDRLRGGGALAVTDAYTKEAVPVAGNSVTVGVPPLNYRLLWVE